MTRNRFAASLEKLLVGIILLLGAIVMIYPFVWMISSSFKEVQEMFVIPPSIIPHHPTLHNYRIVLDKMSVLGNMYKNSIIIAASVTVLQALICSAAAFVFAKLKFPGKSLIFMLFMASMMIPGQLTIIPNYIMMKNLHLIDSIWSLVLLGSFSAFAIFLIRQFFLTIPKDLDDASRIDGCNPIKSYYYLYLPLALPVISVNSILTFNGTWGDFFNPLIFLKSIEHMTLPLGISLIQGMYSQQSPAVMMATLAVSIVPVIIVFLLGRKRLIAGITMTGLKL